MSHLEIIKNCRPTFNVYSNSFIRPGNKARAALTSKVFQPPCNLSIILGDFSSNKNNIKSHSLIIKGRMLIKYLSITFSLS